MKNTKKGFTIVELVIVIAVIAILAAVLIPTFSNVIQKANDSKALQLARNANTEYLAELGKDINATADYVIVADGYVFEITDCQINTIYAAKGVTATEGTADANSVKPVTLSAGTANTATGKGTFSTENNAYAAAGTFYGATVYVTYVTP